MKHIRLFRENYQEGLYQKAVTAQVGAILPDTDIFVYVQYLHTKEENMGNLEAEIAKHKQYQMREIDIHDLEIGTSALNADVVDDYKNILDDNQGFYPPIVLDPQLNIIDGFHRANALSESGVTKIRAWVGL